jgi:DNA-binding LacI/PurR family transcriptional regulator
LIEGGVERRSAFTAMTKRLQSSYDFTAVFASNDMMAFEVKEAFDQVGLRVPEDLSLMGYDNIPFSAALGLTTVDQRAYEIGRNALLLLLDYIQKRRSDPKSIVLSPGLIIRKSCGRAPS